MAGASWTQRLRARAERVADRLRLRLSIRHLHGPRDLGQGADEVTVVALVRDGAYYLDAFFDHYRRLGVRHFVFIDNGSTDGTLDRIRAEPGTVIVQSKLRWGRFENDFRRYAAETYCRERWVLYADMDEMFDFPGAAEIGLGGLVRYMGARGYTALVAQMLEMFPDRPIGEVADLTYAQALEAFRFCDLGGIVDVPYTDTGLIHFAYWMQDNRVSNPDIRFLFGGIRNKVFGELCCLSKHPLVFVGEGVEPGVHPHCSAHVSCADFTALIRHYKFANNPQVRDARTVAERSVRHGEDQKRLAAYAREGGLTLYSDDAVVFEGFDQLIGAGFLIGSPAYDAFLQEQSDAG